MQYSYVLICIIRIRVQYSYVLICIIRIRVLDGTNISDNDKHLTRILMLDVGWIKVHA